MDRCVSVISSVIHMGLWELPVSIKCSCSWTTYIVFLFLLEANSISFNQASNSSNQVVGLVAGVAPDTTSEHRKEPLGPIWKAPSPGSKMPPLETFKLTKKLVQKRAKDNVIIVTFGNFAFMDFILSWVKHLSDMGVDNLLVVTYSHNGDTLNCAV
ncbi:xyloglucanase 113 [Perilla frutescens var. hirtella]|nr:xyloglucanase 113 [Perilla frutescens var. hirtella]